MAYALGVAMAPRVRAGDLVLKVAEDDGLQAIAEAGDVVGENSVVGEDLLPGAAAANPRGRIDRVVDIEMSAGKGAAAGLAHEVDHGEVAIVIRVGVRSAVNQVATCDRVVCGGRANEGVHGGVAVAIGVQGGQLQRRRRRE